MKKCGFCNLYVENEAKFCPYCGERIYSCVESDYEYEEVEIKREEYKYNGEMRQRYQVVRDNEEKIFAFVPDFMVDQFTDAWIYRNELWMSVRYGQKHKIYKMPVNGRKSKLIADFDDEPAEIFIADEQNGDVYLFAAHNQCICHISRQGREIGMIRLLPEQEEKLKNAGPVGIYQHDLFIFKNKNNVYYEYADGKLEEINSRFDFGSIGKKLRASIYNKVYYTKPSEIKYLNDMEPSIYLYIPERDEMIVRMGNVEETIQISTGEFKNSYAYQKEEPEKYLIEWETVKEQIPQLEQFFAAMALYDSIRENRGYAYSKWKTEIYGVYEYDEHSVVFAAGMNETAVRQGLPKQMTACYDIDEQTLYWIPSEKYAKGLNIKEKVLNENRNHSIPYAKYKKMQNLAGKRDELFSQYKSYFEKFINVINKNLEKQAYTAHKTMDKKYSLDQFSQDLYLFLGVIVDQKTISWVYPPKGEYAGGNITGFIWVMNLEILGCKQAMAVQFDAGCNEIDYYVYKPKATKKEWYQEVAAWYKDGSQLHRLGIPHIPNQNDAVKMIPMLGKEDQFEVKGTPGNCRNGQLWIVTRHNDTYYSTESINPMNQIYANMTVYCKLDGGLVAHPYLTSLRAYAYSKQGIFYATKDGAYYLHQNGNRVRLNEQTNIMGAYVEGDYVCFTLFEKLQQTHWNEHFDTFMGLDEEWRDGYKVITKMIKYSIAEVVSYA